MSQIKASIQWTQGVINSDPFKMETSKGQLGLDLLANLLISRFENPKNLLFHKTSRQNLQISIQNNRQVPLLLLIPNLHS